MDLLRRVIVTQTGTIAGASSLDLGVFPVARYARFAGFAVADSLTSATGLIDFRFQIASGTTVINSTLAINSGGTDFSVVNNGGVFCGFGITSVGTPTPYSISLFGEGVR